METRSKGGGVGGVHCRIIIRTAIGTQGEIIQDTQVLLKILFSLAIETLNSHPYELKSRLLIFP